MSMMTHGTAARKSVPLTTEDIEAARRLRELGSAERVALEGMGIKLSATPSEGEIYNALITAGRGALQERVAETGYAAYAASMDEEDRDYERAIRARGERRLGFLGSEA